MSTQSERNNLIRRLASGNLTTGRAGLAPRVKDWVGSGKKPCDNSAICVFNPVFQLTPNKGTGFPVIIVNAHK